MKKQAEIERLKAEHAAEISELQRKLELKSALLKASRNLIEIRDKQIVEIKKHVFNFVDAYKSNRRKGEPTLTEVNAKRQNWRAERQDKISMYLISNPEPNTKGKSIEDFLIDTLSLKDLQGKRLTSRTIQRDFKALNLDIR
jgi:hypothetical protein